MENEGEGKAVRGRRVEKRKESGEEEGEQRRGKEQRIGRRVENMTSERRED